MDKELKLIADKYGKRAVDDLKNKLISFGIVPKEANTGYGYIEAKLDNTSDFYSIQSFKEKPDKKIAIELGKNKQKLGNLKMN